MRESSGRYGSRSWWLRGERSDFLIISCSQLCDLEFEILDVAIGLLELDVE